MAASDNSLYIMIHRTKDKFLTFSKVSVFLVGSYQNSPLKNYKNHIFCYIGVLILLYNWKFPRRFV